MSQRRADTEEFSLVFFSGEHAVEMITVAGGGLAANAAWDQVIRRLFPWMPEVHPFFFIVVLLVLNWIFEGQVAEKLQEVILPVFDRD